MVRSRVCLAALAALLVPSVIACSATVTPVDLSGAGQEQPGPTLGTPVPPTETTPPTTKPPEKVVFGYTSVPLPQAGVSISAIGGSSASDVWIVGSESGSTSSSPWIAYHYDGSKWSSTPLSTTKGRPSFGVVSLGGSNVYLGFSYSADIFQLSGSTFTKKASFSVTSGYTMAAVGSKVFIGTQENFGAGPLYTFDGTSSKQIFVTDGLGGVNAIWGASEDDVWLARSSGLGHLVNGTYDDADSGAFSDVHGSAKDDVWAVSKTGLQHYDGSSWKDVSFPGGTSDPPRTVTALSKDEVIVTTYSDVYRWDGSAFVKESRSGAPKSVGKVGRIGKNEAWLASSTEIGRLAPTK
ncbi:MAG: hypothetical protein JST00_18305 [Deltaproteobacteria bacterium]|nr:hypothetical protein [Deltaproteobacteria bacterium]